VFGETVQVTRGGGYDTDPVWSPDGTRLAWLSMARDGYEADKTRLLVADLRYPIIEDDFAPDSGPDGSKPSPSNTATPLL
jgi:hypothetical protein